MRTRKVDMDYDKKYNIRCVKLEDYNPDFAKKLKQGDVHWEYIPRNQRRVLTFLIFIAKIKFNHIVCYSCLPREYSSEYFVFVDIDDGNLCLLLSTIRDSRQYTNSGIRVEKLQKELILLDVEQDVLLSHRKEIVCLPRQDE